jgi:hypothetical protein
MLKSHLLIHRGEKELKCLIQWNPKTLCYQSSYLKSHVLWIDTGELFTIVYIIYYNFPINLCSYLHCCYISHFRLKTSYHRISVDMFQVILERNLLNACSSIQSVLIIHPPTWPNMIFFSILDRNFSNACSVPNLLSHSHLASKDMF